jgi:hypothetical protein
MPLLEAPEPLEVPLGLEGQSTKGSITLKLEMDVAPASNCLFPVSNWGVTIEDVRGGHSMLIGGHDSTICLLETARFRLQNC